MATTTKRGEHAGGKSGKSAESGKGQAGKAASRPSSARPAARKDPEGGLTDAGRAFYAETEGAKLKPGVTKPDREMTPEDMKRKGSFLRRHFANPRGPMMDDQGRPTRLALSAHAWGEKPPEDEAGARRLAEKGSRYLEKYQAAKADGGAAPSRPRASGGTARPSAAKREKRG